MVHSNSRIASPYTDVLMYVAMLYILSDAKHLGNNVGERRFERTVSFLNLEQYAS